MKLFFVAQTGEDLGLVTVVAPSNTRALGVHISGMRVCMHWGEFACFLIYANKGEVAHRSPSHAITLLTNMIMAILLSRSSLPS